MKLIGILLLLVAVALMVWSIQEFIPTCVQYGVAPGERTCSGQPAVGIFIAMAAVTLAAAALRILSSDRQPATRPHHSSVTD